MKKNMYILLVLVLLLSACFINVGMAGQKKRKQTLMVYMCGSNLESSYGLATRDVNEMMESGFQDDEISVLVMAGGTKKWKAGYNSQEITIHEIQNHQQHMVWHSDQRMNMGEQETLTQLLRFGAENYPAESYSLVFWNHGGGPLDGVCWDELFSMDSLSIPELAGGIREAGYSQKLSWIGFDACLMCTVEVANALSPYAEYMIGSQELEPATGWDYSFLKGLESDQNGGDTGKRIVNTYFESLVDSNYLLTMACIDLSKIDDLMKTMNNFFSTLSGMVNRNTFAEVSRIRNEATEFGVTVRAAGEDGYDLVDLGDLISGFDQNDPLLQEAIQEALQEAVVVSRSSGIETSGLSVYHPYMNKDKYLEKWRDNYNGLAFNAGYMRYLDLFGVMLFGEELVDWSGLTTQNWGMKETGAIELSLQLTEEQKANIISAQLMIMQSSSLGSQGKLSLYPVFVGKTELTEKNTISSKYPGRALYVIDTEGNVLAGPICYLESKDGETCFVLGTYRDYSTKGQRKNDTSVLYHCKLNPQNNELEAVREFIYDEVTGTFTNRLSFFEEGYTNLNFWMFIRNMPYTEGAVPGFDDWANYDGYLEKPIKLPINWHFQFRDNWEGTDQYAMFQVTDVRQNTWCSEPVPIGNPHIKVFTENPEVVEGDGYKIEMRGVVKDTQLYPSLKLNFDVKNTTKEECSFSGENLVLNGKRLVERFVCYCTLKPGESEQCTVSLQSGNLIDIAEIRTMDFTLTISGRDYDAETRTVPVHFELEGVDVSSISLQVPFPLDNMWDDGVLWQLISLEQKSDGNFSGMLFVQNETDRQLNHRVTFVLNGVREGRSITTIQLLPHTEGYFPFTAYNEYIDYELNVEGDSGRHLLYVNQALEQAGVESVNRLELLLDQDDDFGTKAERTIVFVLPEELPLKKPEHIPQLIPLLEGSVNVNLESVLVADDGIGLGVRMTNDTDKSVFLTMRKPMVNRKEIRQTLGYGSGITLPAHTSAVRCWTIESQEGINIGDIVDEMQFFIRIDNVISEPIKLVFPEGVIFGTSGGTMLQAMEMTKVISAEYRTKPLALSEEIVLPESEVHPIKVKAPLTEQKAEKIEYAGVHLCIMGNEMVNDSEDEIKEMTMTRNIVSTSLQRDRNGDWIAELSGVAVIVDDRIIEIDDHKTGDYTWKIDPDMIYFYSKEEDFKPNNTSSIYFDMGYKWNSDISLTLESVDDKIYVTDSQMKLTTRWDFFEDDRTNCMLEEVELAVAQNRVFFGTDRMTNINTRDYYETYQWSLETPITLKIIPVESIKEEKCLYYVFFYTDGTREDMIVDINTGKVLERTFMEAETQ